MLNVVDITGKTILVADDELINIKFLQKILEKNGLRTITATCGQECIEKAKKFRPDLILLDVRMPVMDGLEVCRVMNKGPGAVNIPVIFVTGDTDDLTLKAAFEAGGTDYVRKPVNRIELMARVNSVFSHMEMVKKNTEDEKLKGTLEMAGTVCHELNQPLQYISGASQLLSMDLAKDDPLRERIAKIKEHVDKMALITKKLMGITSVEERDYVGETKILEIDKSSKAST